MAKHYLGGHTIVGRDSGWFTGVTARPVGDNAKPWVPKKPKAAPAVTKPKAAPKSATKAVQGDKTDVRRIAYIHSVLDAHFLKREVPDPPKKFGAVLAAQVQRAGSPLRWARAQPEFEKIILKKRKKHKAELPPVPQKPVAVASVPVTVVPVSTRVEILREDRRRLEMRREAALNTIRECESQLSSIAAELRKLGLR